MVFGWPIQNSEEIAGLRLMLKEYAKRAEESKTIEDAKRMVMKCERKLKEMDKIDAKAQEKGEEFLDPAEVAKRLRRPAIEDEYEKAQGVLSKLLGAKQVADISSNLQKDSSDDEEYRQK